MKKIITMCFALFFVVILWAQADTIVQTTKQGDEYTQFISKLNVEKYWEKGYYIDWESGQKIDEKAPFWAINNGTHCSGFVSSVCAILNIPILHPPFPSGSISSLFAEGYGNEFPNLSADSDRHLATKQGRWLEENAQKTFTKNPATKDASSNWVEVNSYQAQIFANQGFVVVAVYESRNSKPGHIVLVVPFQKNRTVTSITGGTTQYESFEVNGPYEAQAGKLNSSYTTISIGFSKSGNAPIRWYGASSKHNLVKFYVYYKVINWSGVRVPTIVK